MSNYEKSFLAFVHGLLREREKEVCRDHSTLIGEFNVALNFFFVLPHFSRAVHGEDRLGVACVMHHTKAANDFLAALNLISESLHAQAANAARAAFETACQGVWLHIKQDRLDPWWEGARISTTQQIRSDLPRSELRHFLYSELCEIAHPRRRSMEFLITRSAETGARAGVGLVPPYDKAAVHHTLLALYLCIFCNLCDFEQLHVPAMCQTRLAGWEQGFEPIREYYERVIVPELEGLRNKQGQ